MNHLAVSLAFAAGLIAGPICWYWLRVLAGGCLVRWSRPLPSTKASETQSDNGPAIGRSVPVEHDDVAQARCR